MILRLAIPLFLASAATVTAQQAGPSFDCANPASDAEEVICDDAGLAELDRELDRSFHAAMRGLEGDAAATLRAEQRGWIKGRDECWKSSLGLGTCVANEYAFRLHDLREGHAAAREGDGLAVGPVALRCEGLDALVGAVFLNGMRPLISLRWGENMMALPGVPSGSGARYASEEWDGGPAELWTQGDEAILTLPGEAERSCTVEPIA